MIFRILLLLIFAFGVTTAFAQETPKEIEPIETDRPDMTEASSVVPVYTVQVESGAMYEVEYNAYERYLLPTTLTRIGILENMELRVILENQTLKIDSANIPELPETEFKGMAPVKIGTKIYICDEKGFRPEIAFIGHLQLPGGGSDFKAENVTPDFRFCLSNTLSGRFSLGYNVGYEWEDAVNIGKFIYTTSLAASLSEKIGCYVEVFGEKFKRAKIMHSFDGGLTYKPIPNVQFDAAAGFGLTKNAPDLYLGAGLSFRLPR